MLTNMNVIGILYIYEFGTIKIRWHFFLTKRENNETDERIKLFSN